MLRFGSLLVVAFLAAFLAAARASSYHYFFVPDPQPPEGVVFFQFQGLTLPCSVELNSSLHSPTVSWYHKIGPYNAYDLGETYIACSDTEFWEQRNRDHFYCQYYGYSIYRTFPEQAEFSCNASADGQSGGGSTVYNCDYSMSRGFVGDYQCRVTAVNEAGETVNVESKNVTVRYHPHLIIEPPFPVCFHPNISDLNVTLVSNNTRFNLTWMAAGKPDSGQCKLKYCRGSRRFRVRMTVFNNPPHGNDTMPDQDTGFINTEQRRELFYIFDEFHFSAKKYYKFEVQNERDRWFDGQYYRAVPYVEQVITVSTGILYFREQERAHLIEPDQEAVSYAAVYEELVTIKCEGAGKPSPDMVLEIEEESGERVTYRTGQGPLRADLVVNRPVLKFFCKASNYIVNDGVVELVSSVASITIKGEDIKKQ